MKTRAIALVSAMALLSSPAWAAEDTVKIGFVTTITTPAGVIGKDMVDAVNIAVDHLGGKMGDKSIELIVEDDQFKPDIGKQATEKLIKEDDVDFVTGYIWSHVLLASAKPVIDSGKFLISSNAGPSQLAGKQCDENFFSTSWQNDQTPMAMGEVLNQRGVKSLYVIAPNYAAGKNMVSGVERTFKGEIAGKDMTKWPDQIDFSAELAKARASNADGIFIFFPGKHGGAFIKQYQQAGLDKEIPLYTVFTVDSLSLPKFQEGNLEGVLGSFTTSYWSPDLDTPQNKKFVNDFKAKHGRYPSHYAAQSYDTIMLIDSAVRAVDGDTNNIGGLRAAMEKADYPSLRGKYAYGNNHFPIQNFYLREVVKDDSGDWTSKIVSTVYKDHQDVYAVECKLD
ncbi:MAG: ABC transporter substrate-binding protein [Hyphomicrobiales bacterium]|nr:ABC transporter substrate-binding protein [Hyphomicrobiales bacterium]